MELDYIRDSGVEMVIPAVYGEEGAEPKDRGTWSEAELFAALESSCTERRRRGGPETV